MATVQLVFSEMRESDLPEVLEIERQSYAAPWSRGAFLSELRDNAYAHYIVARENGVLVGYAGMWLIVDEAHVTNIAVAPQQRGQRVGHMLLSELEERARQRGMTAMTLEVRVSNRVAERLYLSHGFVPRGVRRRYYTDNQEDAIIMWKCPL